MVHNWLHAKILKEWKSQRKRLNHALYTNPIDLPLVSAEVFDHMQPLWFRYMIQVVPQAPRAESTMYFVLNNSAYDANAQGRENEAELWDEMASFFYEAWQVMKPPPLEKPTS